MIKMRLSHQYLAVVISDDPPNDLRFRTWFPDIPGLRSVGATVDDALSNAQRDLDVHAYMVKQAGGTMPVPGKKHTMCEDVYAIAALEVR